MENDTVAQAGYETKNAMYEAKLAAGEDRMKKQDITKKVSAPLDIGINQIFQSHEVTKGNGTKIYQ